MRTRTAVGARVTPVVLSVGLLVVVAVAWLVDPHALRVVAALVVCLLLPGAGWARRMRLRDGGDTLALTVVLSICATAVVGTLMAVTHHWSPLSGLVILLGVSAAGFVPAGAVVARIGSAVLHRPRPRRALDPAVVAAAEDAAEEWTDWYADARRRADAAKAQQLAAAEAAEQEWRDWYAATHQQQESKREPVSWS